MNRHKDHDVFGDGSVMILSTPGRTPGHQSLLVLLPKMGALVRRRRANHDKPQSATLRYAPASYD